MEGVRVLVREAEEGRDQSERQTAAEDEREVERVLTGAGVVRAREAEEERDQSERQALAELVRVLWVRENEREGVRVKEREGVREKEREGVREKEREREIEGREKERERENEGREKERDALRLKERPLKARRKLTPLGRILPWAARECRLPWAAASEPESASTKTIANSVTILRVESG